MTVVFMERREALQQLVPAMAITFERGDVFDAQPRQRSHLQLLSRS